MYICTDKVNNFYHSSLMLTETLLVRECLLMRTNRCYHFCSEVREYKTPLLLGDGMREIQTEEPAGSVRTWILHPVGHHI